jgi:hypothetical protein
MNRVEQDESEWAKILYAGVRAVIEDEPKFLELRPE